MTSQVAASVKCLSALCVKKGGNLVDIFQFFNFYLELVA